MKGIILAGGTGTRLFPLTRASCKQLLPVYDKPMIQYPLSILMLAGIREILVICSEPELPRFEQLLGTGRHLGLHFEYAVQTAPRGIADAFLVGADFIDGDPVCLILGDNLLYGHGLPLILQETTALERGATTFGYFVKDPRPYAVVEFDSEYRVLSIEEKPRSPRSNYVLVGLYFYDNKVVRMAERLKPSARGELEITDLNNLYLKAGQLSVRLLGRGFTWIDTGTHASLLDAALFVRTIEERQGLKIACVEEIAYKMNYIDEEQLRLLAEPLLVSGYGEYLLNLIDVRYSD